MNELIGLTKKKVIDVILLTFIWIKEDASRKIKTNDVEIRLKSFWHKNRV